MQVGPSALAVSAAVVLRVAGLAFLAFVVATAVAVVYRWYFRSRIGVGLSLFVGVSTVALYLNTKSLFGAALAGTPGIFDVETVVFNSVAFVAAAAVGPLGARAGDRLAVEVFAFAGARELEGEVSQLVQAVGRVIAVQLPEDVDDIENYDPVPEETKDAVAGKTLLFPRRLTVEELHDRVVNRLKDDHDVGYVDLELEPDGTVTYLALGRRLSGLGPTLAPGTAAVAIRADPPNTASPGDVVQLWDVGEGEERERVATGELRGAAEDVVTVALDEQDARTVAGGDYRLLTLPSEPSADRQFASLLRAADETMAVVDVDAESALVGATVGDLDVTVAAIQPGEGAVVAIPPTDRAFEAGDAVYVVARPEAIRRVEERAARAGHEHGDAAADGGTDEGEAGASGDAADASGTGTP